MGDSRLYGLSKYRCECGKGFRWMPDLRSHQRSCRAYKARNAKPPTLKKQKR